MIGTVHESFRSTPARGRLRWLLFAEVFGYAAAVTLFSWSERPQEGVRALIPWVFLPLAIAWPLIANAVHGDGGRAAGVRLDNLRASAREVLPVVLAASLLILAVGWAVDGLQWTSWPRLTKSCLRYVVWGPFQQFLLCGFLLRRLLQAGLTRPAAVTAAALLFGLAHSPNTVLVACTSVMGLAFAILFLRRPNIFTLGIGHGLLAVLLYHAWPVAWHQRMTIGSDYIERTRLAAAVESRPNTPGRASVGDHAGFPPAGGRRTRRAR